MNVTTVGDYDQAPIMQITQPYPHINSVRISHSTKEGSTCARRGFEFKKLFKHGYGDTGIPAEVGKALHTGYQSFLQHGDKDRAIFDMMLQYPFSFFAKPSEQRTIEACYATMQALMDSNAMSEFEIATFELNGKVIPAIEVPFQINFPNFSLSNHRHVEVYYSGFMDLIAYDHLNDEYVVIDIKSHRENSDDLTAKYQHDEQILPYALVLQKLLNKPINSLRVIYLSTYVDVVNPRIQKYDFQKSQQDIQDWARGLYVYLTEMRMFFDLEWFPRKSSMCWSWNKACPHLDLCALRDPVGIQQYLDLSGNVREELVINPWITIDLDLAA